ncbi:hypothetical protein F2Q70_00012142 [Brassica cretica]|uniref:Uncharacterized protein n=1 Tax=Brassica cretica TaxID=69181 RepID=A0A8S9M2Q9_BRACR|nr:hypothetical protein F2Q70_00012142 [Brassica cretica]KAF3542277.1 hypothetical protein DY000_02007967 [Brassica cretica]
MSSDKQRWHSSVSGKVEDGALVARGLWRRGDRESGGREQSERHGACGEDATEKLVVVRRGGGRGACGEERRSWRGD